MQGYARSVTRSALFALQALGTLYVAFISWLMAQWMVDDSWAFRAAPIDWWRAAGFRFIQGVLIGAVLGLVLVGLNKFLARTGLTFSRLGPWQVGWGALAVIAAASAIGAIQFAIEKPFM